MAAQEVIDAVATDPKLDAVERAGRPAFVVDASGAVVWAGRAARRLLDVAAIDEAAERNLARLAEARASSLVRLRIGALGQLAPLAFQSRPIEIAGETYLALEGLTQTERPVENPAPVAAAREALEARAEDGFAELEAAESDVLGETDEPEALPVSDEILVEPVVLLDPMPDSPPDPRRDGATALADASPETLAGAAAEAEAAEELSEPEVTAATLAAEEPFRFVFEIDAARKLTYLSPELQAAVGPSAACAVGRSWAELSQELAVDPHGAVAEALGRTGGWSEIETSWPTADGRRLPLALSALPMFDSGRTFVGFRGLGRSLGSPVEAPAPAPVAPEVPAQPEPEVSATEAALVEPVAERPELTEPTAPEPEIAADRADETADRADPTGSQDVTDVGHLADLPEAADAPDVVGVEEIVDVRDIVEIAELRDALEAAPAETPADLETAPVAMFEPPAAEPPATASHAPNVVKLREAAPPLPALSSVEESAFDEIARRLRGLGVRASATPPETPEIDTARIAPTPARGAPWTIDDVDGRAPTASRVDDLLRLLDRLPIGAMTLRAGEIVYANRAALDMFGHPDLQGLAERDADTLFAEAMPRDDAAPATMRLIARDGVEVEVEARLQSIAWHGAPATLVALKRADAAIAAAKVAIDREKESAAILDVATDGVMTLDDAGRILSVNRSAENLFGFEGRDVVGSLFTLSLAPESRRVAFDYLDRLKDETSHAALEEGREVLGLARQGGAIPLYLTLGRVGGQGSNRFCAVLRDISPWKRAEEELLAAKRQAERANAQKSEFLSKVSHEIRTPLNAIIGFAEVMMEERFGPIGSPRYKDYLRDIHVSGGHLIGLVNDLVDITRIESGALKLDPSPVDLNEIAAQAAALLQPQANRDHVIIRTSLARGLPHVMADRRSVRQIMTNLAANAVRLSRPGGQVIVATALTDVGQAVIRVRDAGLGMSKQELARALEPFRSLGMADNDSGSGGGLGLPLTKALAEANDAAFALQSELGHGTLAEVTFPPSRVLAG